MNDQTQIPVQELLALLGQKELEIHLLRKALAKFAEKSEDPGAPDTPKTS